jgi:hypothetical protein
MSAAAAAAIYSFSGALAPVAAADLGGGCCGDLEERVAELEATTARKGNRKVSLEISGQVNRALLIWDDGVDSDAYIVDPDSDGTRFRFTGKAQMKPGWEAGFIVEFNVTDAASNRVDQTANGDDIPADGFSTRQAAWYIEATRFGRITLGQFSQPTDGINEIDVVPTYVTVSKSHYAGGFFLRNDAGGFTGVRWGDVLGAIGGTQEDIVRYDTPTIYGFIASASWGDNDIWDVALRFSKEFNSVKIAAGIGYLADQRDIDESRTDDQLSGSISAQHVPTGLFASFAAGQRSFKDGAPDAENWYVKGGISKNWLSYGATTLFVDYAKFKNFGEGADFSLDGGLALNDTISASEASVFGFGVVQSFDAAALNVYAVAQFFEADFDQSLNGGVATAVETEDHFAIVIGSHIKF